MYPTQLPPLSSPTSAKKNSLNSSGDWTEPQCIPLAFWHSITLFLPPPCPMPRRHPIHPCNMQLAGRADGDWCQDQLFAIWLLAQRKSSSLNFSTAAKPNKPKDYVESRNPAVRVGQAWLLGLVKSHTYISTYFIRYLGGLHAPILHTTRT